jgi:Domain of unknown function (DUF4352)
MQNSLKILGGIALIAAVGGCSSSATSSAADSSTVTGAMAGTSAHSTSAPGARIGDTVSDGTLSFTVTQVTTADRTGHESMGTDARGKVVILHVTVKNTGDQVRAFDAANQVLWSGNAKYKATVDAKSLVQQISPRSEVASTLTYDVPKDFNADTATIAFRGAVMSGGTAKVILVK